MMRRPYHPKDMSYMTKPCYVYVLIRPDKGVPIYIGISVNPWWRFQQHCKDPSSAAYPVMSFMFEGPGRGFFTQDEVLKIYKKCASRREAEELEYRLVTSTPNLLNRPYRQGRAY